MDFAKNKQEQILQSLPRLLTPGEYPKFLSFSSRFFSYSTRNLILMYLQAPGLQYAAGCQAWKLITGKAVPPDLKPVTVLYPEYHAKHHSFHYTLRNVFDCPYPETLPEQLTHSALGQLYQNGKIYTFLVEYLKKETGKSIYPSADDSQTEIEVNGNTILVPYNIPNRQKFQMLFTYFLDLFPSQKNPSPDSVRIRDSIRYLVRQHYGIESKNLTDFSILSLPEMTEKQKTNILQISLDTARKVSQGIDSCYYGDLQIENLYPIHKERIPAMTLDFNETCIVNQTLFTDNKEEYLSLLQEAKAYTEEEEILKSMDSLIRKLSVLDDTSFRKLREDRTAQRIFTYPPYRL